MTPLHDVSRRGFASDNQAGAHPEVLRALADANGGHQSSYGADDYTARLAELMRAEFGEQAQVFPVFNGTGANVTALTSLVPRWGAVVCAHSAHLENDEGGAPEKTAGLKLLTVDVPDGKLTPDAIDRQAWGWGVEHRAQPLAVSITDSTELGTVYTIDEIRAVTDHAHRLGMKVHLDGARLSNAAAALGVPLRDFTTDAGVDILTFGGTKNGALFGEAIVVLDPTAWSGLSYLRKSAMQLPSKMRFVSAQLIALLTDDLHLRSAAHANAMASRLRSRLEAAAPPNLAFSQPTEANVVFATMPNDSADRLRAKFAFYDWNRTAGEVRLMCAFDTTEDDVDAFADAIVVELSG